jgi:predicted oxidoreductase
MTYAPPAGLSCPRIATRDGGPELSRVVAGMWRMAGWGMAVERPVAGRTGAIAVAVAGTTFSLAREDRFRIVRAARGHEVA